MPAHPSSPQQFDRYSRQLILPEIGPAGQERIRQARVLCIGAGGLGSPAALYLVAAGVGCVGIVDFDRVEISNLQRQLLHGTADLNRPKTESARQRLTDLNPEVEIVEHRVQLESGNIQEILRRYDYVIDGTDNLPTRYLVNDACVFLRKPNVYGAILRFEGQASLFAPHLDAPCYRCLYPEAPPPHLAPSCADAGVLGVVPGVIGTLQATETLKLILGVGRSLLGRLLLFDALDMSWREIRVQRDPGCPVCGENPSITHLIDAETTCATQASANGSDELPAAEVGVREMQTALLDPSLEIHVLDVREPHEHAMGVVSGTRPMPLSRLETLIPQLDRSASYYLCCRSGFRSQRGVQLLRSAGFARVQSVHGGLLAWVREIDPDLPLV